MRDFYVPYFKPTPEQELKVTRLISLVIAFVPLIFVFFVPEILKLSFFTRALRLSISIVAVIGFYLPLFSSGRGATLGLLAAAVLTSIWYVLGNPFGIDNMYIAAVTPLVVMAIERALAGRRRPPSPTDAQERKCPMDTRSSHHAPRRLGQTDAASFARRRPTRRGSMPTSPRLACRTMPPISCRCPWRPGLRLVRRHAGRHPRHLGLFLPPASRGGPLVGAGPALGRSHAVGAEPDPVPGA